MKNEKVQYVPFKIRCNLYVHVVMHACSENFIFAESTRFQCLFTLINQNVHENVKLSYFENNDNVSNLPLHLQ